jgi:4-diphosphocytidyl-2-C-methyl-D-erythritol kinase
MLLTPANAKINLALSVRGRRGDGFHEIDSVVVPIDWHDLLGIEVGPAPVTTVRLRVTGEPAGLPPADRNLAVRAAHELAGAARPLDFALWLDKRIPSAAGLGGGSADAAAVLLAGAALLGVASPGLAELDRLAVSLGSDVPVLMARAPRRVRGRGELLEQIVAPPLHLAVAVAGASGTAATYAAVQPRDVEGATRSDALVAALATGARLDDDLLGSGLEAAACRAAPPLEQRLRALRLAVPQVRWHLTGSGGAAFAIAADAGHATRLAQQAAGAGFPSRACRSLSG